MKTRITIATLALLFAAGCFPDISEGKSKATVSTPSAAATKTAEKPKPTAQEKTLAIDTSRSNVAAVGAKVTRKHDIAFDDWDGTLTVSGSELTGVNVTIEMASIRADVPKLTGHLKSPDFFEVDKYPTATFTSTSIEPAKGADGASHLIRGDMTMHGVTKQLSFPAKVSVDGENVEANAEFVIDRKDFGITYPGMPDDLIKDDVVLTIALVGSEQDA